MKIGPAADMGASHSTKIVLLQNNYKQLIWKIFNHNLISMDRRSLCQQLGACVLLGVAGCGNPAWKDSPDRLLDIYVLEVVPQNNSYQLTVGIQSTGPEDQTREVRILAYSEQGQQVCGEDLGTIQRGRESTQINCSGFPAIITADAATSVCDDLNIQIVHWIGTEDQKQLRIPDEIPDDTAVYEGTDTRRCNESLPPTRLITTDTATSS